MNIIDLFRQNPGGILVPRIQRGYVQGRDNDKGRELQENFVPELVNAVFGKKPISLDFIYGVITNNAKGSCLLALDGQQRLTTLFLLAWLCGKWNPDWLFAYESRRIPQLFVQGLLDHSKCLLNRQADDATQPSQAIQNSSWFLPVWKKDETVSGMLKILDVLYASIGTRNCEEADLRNVSFVLHKIQGNTDCFDHIFRKMNARGKELSPWEKIKALLDENVPDFLADDWRRSVEGDWVSVIWGHSGGNIVNLDRALEKIVRIAYSSFISKSQDAYSDQLYEMEETISGHHAGNEVQPWLMSSEIRILFYNRMTLFFQAIIKELPFCWTAKRSSNQLWAGERSEQDFWDWLFSPNPPTNVERLRLAFLAERTSRNDATRRRRILLNLLDCTGNIEEKAFDKTLETGLAFLSGGDINVLDSAAFVNWQLKEEENKWILDSKHIMELEKDNLVCHGSFRFIGTFDNDVEIQNRLTDIHSAIGNDWLAFYLNLASRVPYERISDAYVPLSGEDDFAWRELILVDSNFVKASINWFNDKHGQATIPHWLEQVAELTRKGAIYKRRIRKYDGWMFLLQTDAYRSSNSIRLDYDNLERQHRINLLGGSVIHHNDTYIKSLKGDYVDVSDSSWWTDDQVPVWIRQGEEWTRQEVNELV